MGELLGRNALDTCVPPPPPLIHTQRIDCILMFWTKFCHPQPKAQPQVVKSLNTGLAAPGAFAHRLIKLVEHSWQSKLSKSKLVAKLKLV